MDESYYPVDNKNLFYNKKCPDFVQPQKFCIHCEKNINYTLYCDKREKCYKCCRNITIQQKNNI